MELNGFNTVVLMFGLQHPEMNIIINICFLVLQLQNQCLCHVHNRHTIQDGCFIIRTMNKTYSAFNTSDIKLISEILFT